MSSQRKNAVYTEIVQRGRGGGLHPISEVFFEGGGWVGGVLISQKLSLDDNKISFRFRNGILLPQPQITKGSKEIFVSP